MPYEIIEPESVETPTPEVQQPEVSQGIDPIRQATRTGARVGESVLGLPGDIVQFLSSVISPLIIKPEKQALFSDLPIPTSSKIREYVTTPIAEKLGGKGYLDPQSQSEEFADDLVGDVAAMMVPIGGKMPFGRVLATAGLGNIAKQAAKTFDLPEWGQEGIKLGTMLGVNIAGPKKIKNIASNLRQDAVAALPEGAEVSAKPLQSTVNKLSKLVDKGDLPADWKKKIINLDQQIVNNKVPVQDVWDLSQDLNNVFYKQKRPAAFGRAFSEMKKDINATMKHYGKTNPKFYDNWRESNSLFTSLKKAEKLTSSFDKFLNVGSISVGTAGLLLGYYNPSRLLGTAAGAYGIKKAAQTLPMLAQNPTALKYFSKTLASAATNNVRQMNQFAQKLDKELNKGQTPEPGRKRYEIIEPS